MDRNWYTRLGIIIAVSLGTLWLLVPTYYSFFRLERADRNNLAKLEEVLPQVRCVRVRAEDLKAILAGVSRAGHAHRNLEQARVENAVLALGAQVGDAMRLQDRLGVRALHRDQRPDL